MQPGELSREAGQLRRPEVVRLLPARDRPPKRPHCGAAQFGSIEPPTTVAENESFDGPCWSGISCCLRSVAEVGSFFERRLAPNGRNAMGG